MLCRGDSLAAEKSLSVWRWRCCWSAGKDKGCLGDSCARSAEGRQLSLGQEPLPCAGILVKPGLSAGLSAAPVLLLGWADSPTSRRVPSREIQHLGAPARLCVCLGVPALALNIPQGVQTRVKLLGFLRMGHSQLSGLQMGLMTLKVFFNLHNSVIPPVSLKMRKVQLE